MEEKLRGSRGKLTVRRQRKRKMFSTLKIVINSIPIHLQVQIL